MASKLTEKEKQLLDANITTKVGLKSYEDGMWGSQGNKDFVYLELFDENNNFIQFENFPSSDFSVDPETDNIHFYPGKHIRSLGYKSGVFNIKYNFLRKLAGSEDPVLLHTVNKQNTKIGDVYTNVNAIYITDEALVYAATEEQYKGNPTAFEQLAVEDLKYRIDSVSPSRTEVRLRAKKINGSYMDQFVDIQTAIMSTNVTNEISFDGNVVYDSKELVLTPEVGGFLFTQKMIGGTITLENIFKVNQIDVAVRTEINTIKNPSGILLDTDSLGEVINLSDAYEWDENLHASAVKADNWTAGFNYFSRSTNTFFGTAHLGYHPHWVEGEGSNGGNCIKFSDQNELFIDLPDWPNDQRYRQMAIVQPDMNNLLGQGVKGGDIANVSLNIRSTVANKGVQVSLRYANEIVQEERPTAVPEGYFNPADIPPSEPIPTDQEGNVLYPDGFVANTAANANNVELQPPSKQTDILSTYGTPPPIPFYDGAVGDTTQDGDMIRGVGAWKISSVTGGQNPIYTWSPNLVGSEYSKAGALSPEEEWLWDGTAWGVNPNFSSPYPTPPVGTVSKVQYPNAINSHPYQIEGQGLPKFPRNRYPGENRGWQTGTTLDGDDTKMTSVCGIPSNLINNNAVILLKDDLVWIVGDVRFNTNKEKIGLTTIDTMFPMMHVETVPKTDSDGEVVGTHTIYNDIFEHGRIQSITRQPDSFRGDSKRDHNKDNSFIVFYTDGRGNEDSNKVFEATIGEDSFVLFKYLKDLNANYNDLVNQNGGEQEWAFNGKQSSGLYWRHYASIKGTDRLWRMDQGPDNKSFFGLANSGGWFETGDTAGTSDGSAGSFSRTFAGVQDNYFDVHFSEGHTAGHFSHYSGIYNATSDTGGSWIQLKEDLSGVAERIPTNEIFYGAGEVGTEGVDLTFGVRNPAAENFGIQDEDGNVSNAEIEPLYDNGTAIFSFDANPGKEGTLSTIGMWRWSGNTVDGWVEVAVAPPRYTYVSPSFTKAIMAPEVAGQWTKVETQITIPNDWKLDQKWYFYIYGHGKSTTGEMSQGTVWVEDVFIDFTLTEQSVSIPVYKPYSVQIKSVGAGGDTITVNKSIQEVSLEIGAVDDDDDGNPDIFGFGDAIESFNGFKITYTNFNPKDLRTYLKFENNLFLTTNFKSDTVSVNDFPYSIVYKLYEPLPDEYEKFDECIVVKEMADPLEERVKIIDFVNAEEPKLVLKSPDLANVESPVHKRETQYKTESQILTNDAVVSTELRNEFLSQSLDSITVNTDYSRFKNFINFGSSEVRIRNFKRKLEDIEGYRILSSSYTGVSGSTGDMGVYHHKIIDTENKFDPFERYMYYENSSYISSSIGVFHDNAWPKSSGAGTLRSPYVLAHTTSSQATTWFSDSISSASLYDENNSSKLSSILPEHIKFDDNNKTYLKFTDMIGQHFDGIWEYINALGDVSDRRDKLNEGISKDLLYSVGKSLGWNLDDGKDLTSLSKYALGKEVTGSNFSDYSEISERDTSKEIWSRIINNMPFFLKNKGTVRSIKGLLNIYGIPSTILRVKEFGGPDLLDNASPQFEISRKFTKALDFRGSQYVRVDWADDSTSGRKPDTVEFRFRAQDSSNQILVQKKDPNNQDWFIRLKDNGSTDKYGYVSFMLSGSAAGTTTGEYKEILSTELPVYDGDFYSVMLSRSSGSNKTSVSQSYQLSVGKYDVGRSKIHLFNTTTMDVTQVASSSFSNAWTGSGDIYIGGSDSLANVGAQFSGSIMEYRHWTETLNTGSFKNHIANPKAYDGNTVSSSYNNLVLRYSFDDNKNLNSDVEGIRDVSSNQTQTLSGSHDGFTGNFFRSVVDEAKTFIPSIGALRRTTNKVRIESNSLKPGFSLSSKQRATDSAFDTAPADSNKIGIWFAPTDVINNDIINSVGNLNFDNFLGDPRDNEEYSYRGLENEADNYWKKYTAPNNFWDYMRLISYYDQSLYPQIRKLIPARAKPDMGLLIEPNIFERPKVVIGKKPTAVVPYYSSSINIGNMVDGLIKVTGSYNAGLTITDYDAYTGRVDVYSYDTGSSVISSSGEYSTFEGVSSEIKDRAHELSIWQRLGAGSYKTSSITSGDAKYNEVFQPVITGSRIYGVNQKLMPLYSSSLSASLQIAYSSSFYNVDLDNFSGLSQGLINSFYVGVKNTKKTTSDGQPPVEVIISAPTKLVTTKTGDSTLKTGDGIISDFKEAISKEESEVLKVEEASGITKEKKKRGLRKLKVKPETDQDRKKERNEEKEKGEKKKGKPDQN